MKKRKTWRKIVAAAMAATMALAFTGCSGGGSSAPASSAAAAEGTSAAAASESGSAEGALKGVKLKVGTSGLFGPFSYYDSDGKTLIGYDLDLIKALQEKLGFEIDPKVEAMSYSALTTSLSQGKLDFGAAALCATDERKKTMDFSETYCDSGQQVMVQKDNDKGIKSVEDLHGKKVAVEKGTASHTYASKNLTDAQLDVHDTITTAYAALEQGKVDAVIQDGPGCAFYLKNKPDSKLKIVGEEFNQGQAPYAVAFKKNFEHKAAFDQALAELKEAGKLDELYEKWCK